MRPTMTEMREQRDGPPAPRNTTEPCGSCADYGPDELEYRDGSFRGFCRISIERRHQYPRIMPLAVPPDSIQPCWRATGEA